jgi:error-prone DNA polymerase
VAPGRAGDGPVPSFAELRAHTAFSFGDGAVTPERLVERAAALGYRSLGVTDAADLGAAVRLVTAARRVGVRPIVGAELVVDGRPLALLVATAEGCRNLGALVTLARSGKLAAWPGVGGRGDGAAGTDGGVDGPAEERAAGPPPRRQDRGPRPADRHHAAARGTAPSPAPSGGAPPRRGHPTLTWSQVAERSAGLHLLTGPAEGALAAALAGDRGSLPAGAERDAGRLLGRYREAFDDRMAVEVQLHGLGRWEEALAGALVEAAGREGVPWVVATAPRYVDGAGRRVHDVLTALRARLTLAEAAERGVLRANGSWRLRSPDEVARRWAGCEAGLAASVEIAARCDFELGWLRPPLPRFPVPPGESDDGFLAARWRRARASGGGPPCPARSARSSTTSSR